MQKSSFVFDVEFLHSLQKVFDNHSEKDNTFDKKTSLHTNTEVAHSWKGQELSDTGQDGMLQQLGSIN